MPSFRLCIRLHLLVRLLVSQPHSDRSTILRDDFQRSADSAQPTPTRAEDASRGTAEWRISYSG